MYNYQKYIGLSKGVLTITDIISISENKKRVIVDCVCSKCGKHSEQRLDRFTIKQSYFKDYCKHCKHDFLLKKNKEKYIGKRNGVLECLDLIYDPNYSKNYIAVCKCHNCNEITKVRVDRLNTNGKYIPKTCDKCIKEHFRIKTTERYQKRDKKNSIEEYRKSHHDDLRFYSIKQGAKDRKLEFSVTKDKVLDLLHQNCYYCNQPHADGIDRINSNIGYVEGNVVPCCKICNIMKNKFDIQTFYNHIKAIYFNRCHNEGSSTISKESTLQANGSGNGGDPEKDYDIVRAI